MRILNARIHGVIDLVAVAIFLLAACGSRSGRLSGRDFLRDGCHFTSP
jgi:hypothetical protein